MAESLYDMFVYEYKFIISIIMVLTIKTIQFQLVERSTIRTAEKVAEILWKMDYLYASKDLWQRVVDSQMQQGIARSIDCIAYHVFFTLSAV